MPPITSVFVKDRNDIDTFVKPLLACENKRDFGREATVHYQQFYRPNRRSFWSSIRACAVPTIAQLGFISCIWIYTFTYIVYMSPWTQDKLLGLIRLWWRVDPDDRSEGHAEMVRPTFFVLSSVIPMLLSLLLFEWMRKYNLRRISSTYLLKIESVLRRKPRVLGWVCYFSYGELLFQTFLVGGNALTFWWGWQRRRMRIPPGVPLTLDIVLRISGIVLGFNCIFNMAFLFIPATRNCAWMEFFNISYANGVKYHRWLGILTLLTGLAHATSFYWQWIRDETFWEHTLPCFDCQIDYAHPGYRVWFNVFGELALLSFLIIGLTSIPYVRRRMYETFYYTHHLYILGVVFAAMHWVTIIWWLLPTFVLYLISRATSSWNALAPVSVQEFKVLPDGIVKIVISRSTHAAGSYQVGQFVYLNVPAVSRLQWHAFTIGSSPRVRDESLTVLFKALGNWTEDMVQYAEKSKTTNVHPVVYIDGYYGSSLQVYEEYPTVCLIGGGIGVTPLFAILDDMVVKLSDDRQQLRQRVFFIFSFRELSLLAEIHPVLTAIRELDPHGQFFSFHLCLTRSPTEEILNTRIRQHHHLDDQDHRLHSYEPRNPIKPFTQPLRSSKYKVMAYIVMFISSSYVVLWLEYGGGKLLNDGKDTQWWPLERFVEIMVLFVLPLVVYAFLMIERIFKSTTNKRIISEKTSNVMYSRVPPRNWSRPFQYYQNVGIHTYYDLIAEYHVSMGSRPDMKALLKYVHESNQQRHYYSVHDEPALAMGDNIGVFISGPEGLKSATEYAIADLGSSDFDIHTEEFEL